ncbi:MAG: hypothetical protein IK102_06950 [Treponema sp.]|nr:hypothetical protein [Treponema sp.]
MSDSIDNTNELDSYGVWVKNNKQEENTDDLNFADSLDLPDFEETDSLDDTDFADIFEEEEKPAEDPSMDDTTLTDDELMNITSGDGIEIAETTEDGSIPADEADSLNDTDFNVDDAPLDDISFDSLDENSVSDADLSDFDTVEITDEAPAEEVVEETAGDIADFDFETEETAEPAAEEPVAEEPAEPAAEETQDITEDFGIEEASDSAGDEEISLDDFMDEGFSDSSVASGNNGFAADAAPAGGSEEVALDDFVDMSEFGITEEETKKEEAIQDEKPLDMDISFDSSADTIQTEEIAENIETEEDEYQEEVAEEQTSAADDEFVSSGSNDIEAEEVDLSDFGIDAEAEETPVTQDVESEKKQESVVDYDLSVNNANMNAAPVVNEIKEDNELEAAEPLEEIAEEPVSSSDSSLLQQIVSDLSNLKAEINTLKSNLDEIMAAPPASNASSGVISEEIAIDDDIVEDSGKEDTGFFSGDDGDDTIALSTDELTNILNTADFSEETVVADEPSMEEETSVEVESEEVPAEEPAVEPETSIEEHLADSGDAIDESTFDSIDSETKEIEYDFTDDNLSEPNIDEIEIDEESLEDDLPDEITIAKEDDILVESSSSDFMDSVQDTTEEHEAEAEIAEDAGEPEFSTVENVFDEAPASEPAEEANGFADIEVEEAVEPSMEDETFVPEEEVMVDAPVEAEEETINAPEIIENDFISHEEENNNLTEDNIDYLTTEDKEPEVESEDNNDELKKDIKSVLLYMDQLLENLPEEKIVEFAKSDEFTTYKKLFSELGLS